ncbi:MAG: TlpA family protein disulfide reductase [Thermogutta sp.]
MSEHRVAELPSQEDVTFRKQGWRAFLRRAAQLFQILAMVCVLGLFSLVAIKYSPFNPDRMPVGANHPAVGKRLEVLSLTPLTGGGDDVDLDSLAGQVVLINFWGVWCFPCREEFPKLFATVQKFATEPRFRFLSVSCGSNGKDADLGALRRATEEFLAEQGSTIATYADPGLVTRLEVDRVVGFSGYPTTILLDENGVISGVWQGYWRGLESEIELAVRGLLSERRGLAASSDGALSRRWPTAGAQE